MVGEQPFQETVGSGRRRVHHRKSASDTLAFAANSLFTQDFAAWPQPPQQLAQAGFTVDRLASAAADGGTANTSCCDPDTGYGALQAEDLLEMLQGVDEDDLDLDVDGLGVEGEADGDQAVMPLADASLPIGMPASAPSASQPSAAALPLQASFMDQHQQQADAAGERVRVKSFGLASGSSDSNSKREQLALPTAAAAALPPPSSRHTRHKSDSLVSLPAPTGVDKPLSEFAGQTRANALDPSQLDPKRAKRIIANRQSAHRSRMKKLQVIHELEQQVAAAQAAMDVLRQHVSAAASKRRELLLAAMEVHCQLAGLRREVAAATTIQTGLAAELRSMGIMPQPKVHAHGEGQTMKSSVESATAMMTVPVGGSSSAVAGQGSGPMPLLDAGALVPIVEPPVTAMAGVGALGSAAVMLSAVAASTVLPPLASGGAVPGLFNRGAAHGSHVDALQLLTRQSEIPGGLVQPVPGLVPGSGQDATGLCRELPSPKTAAAVSSVACGGGTTGAGPFRGGIASKPPMQPMQPLLQGHSQGLGMLCGNLHAQPSGGPETPFLSTFPHTSAAAVPGVSAGGTDVIALGATTGVTAAMRTQARSEESTRTSVSQALLASTPIMDSGSMQQQVMQLPLTRRHHHRRHFSAGCALELGSLTLFGNTAGSQGLLPIDASTMFSAHLGEASSHGTAAAVAGTDTEMPPAATKCSAKTPLRLRLTATSALALTTCHETASGGATMQSELATCGSAGNRSVASSDAVAKAADERGSPMACDGVEALPDVDEFLIKEEPATDAGS